MIEQKISKPDYTICVFCGSNPGTNPAHIVAAKEVGKRIAQEHWGLIFGAGKSGLMGTVARSVLENGGQAIGVIPSKFPDETEPSLTYTIKTQDIHERKSVMFNCSDAVVVMPGGIGTLEEFFEVLTWKQLGWHNRQILLLNILGYWDGVNQLIKNIVFNQFAGEEVKNLYISLNSVDEMVNHLRADFSNRNCSNE